jgi:membrane protein
MFERFLPPHATGPADPFAAAEALLGRIATFGQKVTLVAVPAFLWFATRAFASARTALNDIYDVSLRPVRRHFLVGFLVGKGRDLAMVVATILLFLGSTAITAGLALGQAWGEHRVPALGFWVSSAGRIVAQLVAFAFIVALFLLLYRFGAQRRMPFKATLVASLFAGAAFELARRLYALYLVNVATLNRTTTDANLGAIILFVVWMYYSALVFLLGAVVAETWNLRHLQQRQRAA